MTGRGLEPLTEAWRDTTAPNWLMSWGEGSENAWLERTLGLSKGGYRLDSVRGALDFRDPKYGDLKALFLYDLVEPRGTRKVVIGEISNGIYAVGYWQDAALLLSPIPSPLSSSPISNPTDPVRWPIRC